MDVKNFLSELVNGQSCRQIEAIKLIFSANQLTGFYMMATKVFNELVLYLLMHQSQGTLREIQ